MQLTQAQIRRFQLLYRERFSVELSEGEAREKGLKLVRIMQQVYRPAPKSKEITQAGKKI